MEEITKNCVETSGSELVSSEPIVNEPENSANSPPKITKKMFVLDPGRLKALGLDAKIKLALAKQNKKKSSTKSQKQLPDPQPPSTNFIEKKNPDKNKEIKIISVVNLDDPIKLDLLSNYSQQTNLIKGFSETNTFITPKKEPTIEILKDEIVDIQDSIKSPKLYRQLIESPKPKNMIYKTTDKNNKETVYKIYLTSISKKSANNNESPTKSPFKPPPDKQQITPVLSTIKKNTPNKPELQKKIIENFSKVFANTPVKFNETVDQDKNTKTSTPNCVIYKSQGGTLTPIKMVCKTPRVSSVKIISKQSPEIKSTGNFSKIDISKLKAKLNENLRKMSGTTPEKKIFEKSPIKSEMIESPKNSIDNVPKDAMERLNDYLKKIQEEKKISKQLIKKSIVNDVPKNSIAPISGISIIPKNKSSEGESSKTVKSTKYPYSIIKCSPKTKKQSKIRGLEISKDGEQFFGFMQKTIKESNQRSTGKLKIMKSLLKENQKELSETEWKIKIDKELNVSPRIEVNKGTKTYSRVPKKILTPVKIDDENSDFDFDDMPFESIDCNVVEYSNDNLIDQKNISIIIQSNNNVFDQTELKSNEESPKTKEITILEHIYEVKANESDSKINEESRTTKLEVIDVKETTFPEKNYEIKEIKANQSQVPEQICEEETVVHAIKEVESDLRLPIEDVILDPVKVIEEVPEPSKEPATSKKSFKQLDIRNCFKKSFKEKILHPQSSSKKPIEQEITEITPSSADSTKEDISPLQSSSIKPTKPSSPESLKGDEHVITKFVDSIFSRVEALEAVEAQNVSNNSSSLDAADSTEEYISPPQSSSIEQTMPEITEITYSSPESLNEDDLVITKFVDSIFSRVEALEAQNVSNNSSSLDAIIIKFVDDIFSKIESLELPDEINRKSIRGSKETESEDIVIEIKKSPVRRRSRRITEGKLSIEDISAVEQSLVDLGMLDETNKSSNSSEDIILEDIEKPKVEAQIPSKPRKGRFMVSNQALKRAGSLMKQPISVQEINHKNIDKEVNFPIEDKEVLKFDENTVKIVSNDEIKKSPIKFQNLHILKRLTRKPNVSNEALKRSGSSIKSNEQKLKEVPKEVVNEVLAIETTKIHNKDSGIVLSSESFNEDEEISIKTDLTSLEVPEKINISGRRSLRNRSIDENETKLHNLKVPSQNRTSRRRSRSLRNKSFVEEFKEESPTKRISRKSENSECHLKVQVNEKLSLKRNLRNSVGNNSEERQISKEVPIVDIPFNEMESENSRNISELESSETGTELESKVREYPENVVMIPPEATIETDKPKEDVKQKTPKRIGRKPIIPIKSTRSLRKSGVLNQEIIALQTEISPKVICSGVSETNLEEVSQKQDEIKSKPSKRIARKPIIPEKSSRSNSMTSVSMEGDFEGPSETFAVSVSEPEEKMSVLHSDPEIKTTVSALVLEAKLVPEPKEKVSEVNKSVQSLELEDKSVTKPNVNSIEKERSVELDKQTEVVNSVPEATRSEENQEEKNIKPSRRITRKPTIPVNSSRSSVSSIPKEEIALVQDETISIVTESEKLVEVKPKPFKRVTRKPIISEKYSRSSKKMSSAPMALKVAENVIDVLPDSDSVLSESLEEKVSASTSPTKEEEKEVANQIIKDVLPDSLPKQDNFVVPELHEEQQQTSSEQISKFPQEKIQEETAVPFSENQEVKKKSSKRGSRKPIIPQTNNRSSRKSVAPVSKENTLESEKEVPISEVQEVVNQSSDVFVATVTSIKRPKSPVVIEKDLSLTHKANPICSTESLEEDEAVINECTDNICSRVEPLEVEVKSEIKVPDLEANIGEIQEEALTSSSPVIIEESPSAEVVKEETKTKSSNRSARKSGKLIRDEEQISNNVVNTVAIEISNPTPENEERSETSKEITKTPPNKEQSELLKEQTNLMEEEHTEKDTVSVNGSEISVIAEIPIQNEDLEPENILETQKPKKRGRQKKNEDISLTPTTSKRNSRKSRVVYKENSDESETEVQTPNIARGRRTIRKDSTVIEQPKSAKRANRLSTASSISDIRDAPEIEEEFNGFVEGDEKLVVKTPSKRARSLSEETLKIEEVPRKKRAYNRKFPKPIVKDEDSNESKKLDDLIEETPKIEEVPRKKRAYNKKVPKPIVKDEDLNESKKLDDLIEETPKIEEVPIKKRAYNRKVPISIVKDEAKKRERTSGNLDDLNESKKQKVSSVVCGNCKETVPVKSWDSHLLRHNGIGWIVGEEEDWDINERNLILKKMLYFIKEKSLSFVTCEKCGITRKSALGLITHQEECGLDDEAVEKKKISCQYCGSRLKAYCLPIHLQNHCFELKRREKEAKEQQEAKDAEEIKTAVDKNVVLLTESGRVKRRSVLKAEHTIKKTTIREAKGSSEDYIGKFHRTKITGGCTRRWARQIKDTQIGKCLNVECSFTGKTVDALLSHSQICTFSDHGTGYICLICKKRHPLRESIKLHIEEVHRDTNEQGVAADYEPSGSEAEIEDESSDEDDDDDDDDTELGVEENEDFDGQDEDYVEEEGYGGGETRIRKQKLYNLPQIILENLEKSKMMMVDYKTILCNAKRTPFFSFAIDWTRQFRDLHYTIEPLYREIAIQQFNILTTEESKDFLPLVKKSPNFYAKVSEKYRSNYCNPKPPPEWQNLETFRGTSLGGVPTFYCGGPVTAMDWVPFPNSYKGPEVLAVVVKNDIHNATTIFDLQPKKCLIQIWDIPDVTNAVLRILSIPKMRYAICFPYGPVWQIKFCPSGGYFDDGSPESRLGLLAVTSLIGDVYLYALPIRANLNEEGNENYSILNLKPSTVLTYDLNKYKFIGEKSQQMTKITWSEAKGHSIFAAGYSSGLISIWKIDTKSILLLQRINDVRTILPVQIIKAHNNSISALSIFYADNSRYMMTGCKDRTSKFYDLQSVPVELTCSQLKSRITCGAWPLHWSGYFLSVDEGYALHRAGTSYVQPLDIGSKQTSMHILNSTACDMDFNDWLNSFIVVTDNGDIVGGYCKQLLFTFAEKDARKFRFIFGCTEVVDLKKEEKIILDCESSYPDKYGLIFCDILDPINSKQCPVDLLNSRRPPIEEYPLTQINQVRCNRNADAYKFYAIGYQAGFVRIRSLRQVK